MSYFRQLPSYRSGFARSASESRYRQLWRGLVGAWCPSLGPTGATLRDWSGRANHGTLTSMDSGADWLVSGGRWALDFDGSDDYVDCGNSAVLNPDRISFSIWFRSTDATGSSALVSRFSGGGGGNAWMLFKQSGESFLRVYIETTTGATNGVNGVTNVFDGQWHFAVVTWDGITQRLYVDGVLDSSEPLAGTLRSTNTNVYIGSSVDGRNIAATIDDVRIYNRPLTMPEITLLYSGGRGRAIAYVYAPRRYVAQLAVGGPYTVEARAGYFAGSERSEMYAAGSALSSGYLAGAEAAHAGGL